MYTVKYEKTNTGYSAWVDGTPAYTTAETLEELPWNIVEAINLHRECMGDLPIGIESIQLVESEPQTQEE